MNKLKIGDVVQWGTPHSARGTLNFNQYEIMENGIRHLPETHISPNFPIEKMQEFVDNGNAYIITPTYEIY